MKNISKEEISVKCNKWLDAILADINELPVAWNFNLYEPFCMELVGTKSFNKKDEDWASDEIFTSRDEFSDFLLSKKSWEEALQEAISLIKNYLENGKHKSKLIESHAVACGFVDGDLELLYINPNKKFRQRKEKITLERINSLPLGQLFAWITVETDYEKSKYGKKIEDIMYNEVKPTKEDLNMMRNFLFESMTKKKK